MTKKKKAEVKSFPISLKEFAGSIKQPETRGGFVYCIKQAGLDRQRVYKEKWQGLLDTYRKKPVGVDFLEWVSTSKK